MSNDSLFSITVWAIIIYVVLKSAKTEAPLLISMYTSAARYVDKRLHLQSVAELLLCHVSVQLEKGLKLNFCFSPWLQKSCKGAGEAFRANQSGFKLKLCKELMDSEDANFSFQWIDSSCTEETINKSHLSEWTQAQFSLPSPFCAFCNCLSWGSHLQNMSLKSWPRQYLL